MRTSVMSIITIASLSDSLRHCFGRTATLDYSADATVNSVASDFRRREESRSAPITERSKRAHCNPRIFDETTPAACGFLFFGERSARRSDWSVSRAENQSSSREIPDTSGGERAATEKKNPQKITSRSPMCVTSKTGKSTSREA